MSKLSVKSTDKAKVMEDLLEAIEAFSHLQLTCHMAHRFLHAVKFGHDEKFAKYGEAGEMFVEMFMRQVFRLGGTVQYDAGTITSPDINDSPSDNVVGIMTSSKNMVDDLAEKCEEWCQDSWDAHMEDCRHDFKDAVDSLHKMSLWLTAQVRWAKDLGAKDYAAAGGNVG